MVKTIYKKENGNFYEVNEKGIKSIARSDVPYKIRENLDQQELIKLRQKFLDSKKTKYKKRSKYRIRKKIYNCREYRSVVEKNLGRKLKKEEIIHHIDGDRSNNSLDNLLITGLSEHKFLHFQLETVAREIYKQNIILFDFNNREYYINPKVKFKIES